MTQAVLAHDNLLPQPPGGNGAGAALALVVHAGLALALTVSVDWRTRDPEVVSAELWASVPQVAAPKAVEPAPAPPVPAPAPTPAPSPPPPQVAPRPNDADIATEQRKLETARKRAEAEVEAERKRLEDEKKKRELAEKSEKAEKTEKAAREAKAAEERLAQQREDYLRRIMGQGPTTTPNIGTAAQDAAPSASYASRIVAAVRRNIVFTGAVNDEATTEVEVRAAPGGTIISSRLLKASGHQDWDEAVLRAIDKTGKLPTDTDGRVPARLLLVFKPRE